MNRFKNWDLQTQKYLRGDGFETKQEAKRQGYAIGKQMRLADPKERFEIHEIAPDGTVVNRYGLDGEAFEFSEGETFGSVEAV